jgi:hypothetical protein
MDDLSQLNRFTDNFIIDELRWHVSNRGIPMLIQADCDDIGAPKVVFTFRTGQKWTHDIDPGFFVDQWDDAATVLRDFPSVPQIAVLPDPVIKGLQPLREQRKDAIERCKSETKQTSEQAGTGQPATRSVDKPEGSDKPQPEAEVRRP